MCGSRLSTRYAIKTINSIICYFEIENYLILQINYLFPPLRHQTAMFIVGVTRGREVEEVANTILDVTLLFSGRYTGLVCKKCETYLVLCISDFLCTAFFKDGPS